MATTIRTISISKDDLDREIEEYRKKHPIKSFYNNHIYQIKECLNPMRWYRSLRDFYLRGRHGWCPRDVWSFDFYLAKVIADGVDHLRENSMSIPIDPTGLVNSAGEPATLSEHAWDSILYQISDGMRAHLKIVDMDYDYKDKTHKEIDELANKRTISLRLLSTHFDSLWD